MGSYNILKCLSDELMPPPKPEVYSSMLYKSVKDIAISRYIICTKMYFQTSLYDFKICSCAWLKHFKIIAYSCTPLSLTFSGVYCRKSTFRYKQCVYNYLHGMNIYVTIASP